MAANGFRCLVVDDEPRIRSALARLLEGVGFDCRQADSGTAALEALEGERFPLVLTDVRMPGMDGVTLLQEIRRRWPDVAVLMLTAVAEVDTAVACLQAGAFDYIPKPFQVDEVRARVAQALEKRRLILENQEYQAHLAEMVDQQAMRIEELFLEGVQTLAHALEAKDAYTKGHSARVAAYAGRLGAVLGVGEADVQLIELGAELHDIGKIGVREDVLQKPGRLSDDEYRHIMEHTVIGARILEPLLKHAPQVLAVVRSHHERLDGSGLPDGLSGQDIPLHARVVSVADGFDAMTTGRPYRPARSVPDALEELRRGKGLQWDGDAVDAFLSVCREVDQLPIPTPQVVRRRVPQRVAAGAIGSPTR
jgi:putative nucleotidyltransferase with HDIG domain